MDRAFMESYFDMAYEDLQGVLMCENEDLKNAQEAFSSSIHQLFDSLPENDSTPEKQHQDAFTSEFYLAEYLLMKYAYLKGAEDRDRMLR